MMRVEQDRQLELAWDRCDSRPRSAATSGAREDDAQDDEHAGDDEQRVDDVVAETPGGVAFPGRELAREDRDEGRAHGAFREQIADQIRDAERDVERVHRVAGAEHRRQHLLAHQAEHAAGHRRGAGGRGGARRVVRYRRSGHGELGSKLAAHRFVDRASVRILAGEPRHHRLHHLAHVLDRGRAPVSAIAAATAASMSAAEAAGGR